MTLSPRLSGHAVWLLSRAALRGTRLVHDRFAEHGLRKQHYGVLAGLADAGASTQAALADRLGLDRSDMVALLDELERRGLVLRAADPADRRCKTVQLTPGGEALLTELDALVGAADDELLDPLTPDERATLVALLARLLTR